MDAIEENMPPAMEVPEELPEILPPKLLELPPIQEIPPLHTSHLRTINSARNLVWADAAKTVITCEVDFDELDEIYVPFSTTANADTPHGRAIWDSALSGEYGDIGPYVAPVASTDPIDYPLNRFQFEALVLAIGLSLQALEAAIDAMPLPPFDKAVALSRLRNATSYNRDHPLVEHVRASLKMPVKDLDTAWMQAAALK